jgi:transcriptional antiterminator RfaH
MPILGKEPSVYPDQLLTDSVYEPDSSDRRWWAIFTRTRHEKALARELLRLQVPFYLPLVAKENVIRNKVVQSYLPLFSGYVFMFTNEAERVLALTTNRVQDLLKVDDQGQLRRDLAQIYRLIGIDAPLTVERRLEPGRKVRIKSGAMRGLEGTIVERRGGQRRLIVAVEFLQNGVSLEIDDFMVEPL